MENLNETKEKIRLLINTQGEEKGLFPYDSKAFINKLINIERLIFQEGKHNLCFLIDVVFEKRSNGIKIRTLLKDIRIYMQYFENTYIDKLTKFEVDIIYHKITSEKRSLAGQKDRWVRIKQYLMRSSLDIDFKRYKVKEPKTLLNKSDLISPEDFRTIFNSGINKEKKIFFSIIYETGARAGEMFNLTRKSFHREDNFYLIELDGKTGKRMGAITENIHLIDDLLNSGWKTWKFEYSTITRVLKRFEFKLNKRLYLHLFRHTRATELCTKLSEQALKKLFGWTKSSEMLETYVHLTYNDAIQEYIWLKQMQPEKQPLQIDREKYINIGA